MLAFFVGWTQVARSSESNFQAAVAACNAQKAKQEADD
jgi:hypothetical protein